MWTPLVGQSIRKCGTAQQTPATFLRTLQKEVLAPNHDELINMAWNPNQRSLSLPRLAAQEVSLLA